MQSSKHRYVTDHLAKTWLYHEDQLAAAAAGVLAVQCLLLR
jgi:hypothetical protein